MNTPFEHDILTSLENCFADPKFDKNSFKSNRKRFREYDIDSSLCAYLLSLPMRRTHTLLGIEIIKQPDTKFTILDTKTNTTTYAFDEHQAVWVLIKIIYDNYKTKGFAEVIPTC